MFFINSTKAPIGLRWRSSSRFITFSMAIGLLTDMAMYGLIVPVMPFRLQALGYDNFASLTGYLIAAYAGGLLISSPPVGYLGEKIKRRRLALVGALVFLAGSIVMFMLATKFWLLLLARIFQGFSGTVLWIMGVALVCDSCERENVGFVLGQCMIGFSVGICLGPPIGGVSYSETGYYSPFYFAIALVVLDIVLRVVIIEHKDAFKWITPQGRKNSSNPYLEIAPTEKESEPAPIQGEFTALWKMCKSPRAGCSIYLSLTQGFVVGALLEGAMTIYLEEKYGFNSLQAGLTFLAAVGPTFFTNPIAGKLTDRIGAKRVAVYAMLFGVPFLGLLIIPQLPVAAFIVILAFFGGSTNAAMTPLMADLSLLVDVIPGLGYAHVFGAFNTAFSAGSLIGPIISGQILEHLGTQKGWQVVGGISVAVFFSTIPFLWLYMGDGKYIAPEEAKELQQKLDLEAIPATPSKESSP